MTDEREILDELAEAALGEDRDAFDDLAGALRVRAAPRVLRVNCGTGEMISPSGRYRSTSGGVRSVR